jgi:hypothetical protein
MRSFLSAGLMGVGGIFVSFGLTVLVIAMFTRTSSMWRNEFPAEMTTGTGFLIVGGVMFVLGWLLRDKRRSDERAPA